MEGGYGTRRSFLGAALAATLAGCGTASATRRDALKVAFPFYSDSDTLNVLMRRAEKRFQRGHRGGDVQLLPIPDNQGNFSTKLALMQRSPASAPDVVYQDTVMLTSDVQAGYLHPLDEYLAGWPAWKQYMDVARQLGRAADNHIYGVLMGTDARAIWYDKRVFREAGLPTAWQPRTWADVLAAARTIKARVAAVIPVNLYASKAVEEVTTTQGLLMLLYGTRSPFYDEESGVWGGNTRGLRDTLRFVREVYGTGLGPKLQDALDPRLESRVSTEWMPEARVGMSIGEGSWLPQHWAADSDAPWPQWHRHMGVAAMPTQHGQGTGRISVSGGWVLGISGSSEQPELAFEFLTRVANRRNSLAYAVGEMQLAVRNDVAHAAEYLDSNPTNRFFTSLLDVTRIRPGTAEYLQVSSHAQRAMESVMTGTDPRDAARSYGRALATEFGAEKVSNR